MRRSRVSARGLGKIGVADNIQHGFAVDNFWNSLWPGDDIPTNGTERLDKKDGALALTPNLAGNIIYHR